MKSTGICFSKNARYTPKSESRSALPRVDGDGWLPPAKVQVLADAVNAACDAIDGIRDSVVLATKGGLAFADLGLFKSAEECYKKSLSLHESYEPHVNLANMYCHEMRLELAADEYRAAIVDDPGNLDARTNLWIAAQKAK